MKVKDFMKVYDDMMRGIIRRDDATKRIERIDPKKPANKQGRVLDKHEMRYAIIYTFGEEFNHLVRLKTHSSKDFKVALKQIDQMYRIFYRQWTKEYPEKEEKSNTALDAFMDSKKKEKGERFLKEDFKTFMLDAFKTNKQLLPLTQEAFNE